MSWLLHRQSKLLFMIRMTKSTSILHVLFTIYTSRYQELCQTIWAINPRCDIILSGILPQGANNYAKQSCVKDTESMNQLALTVNRQLNKIASVRRQLHYVGHTASKVNGKVNSHLLARDGLHLSRAGVTLVETALVGKVETIQKSQHPVVASEHHQPPPPLNCYHYPPLGGKTVSIQNRQASPAGAQLKDTVSRGKSTAAR